MLGYFRHRKEQYLLRIDQTYQHPVQDAKHADGSTIAMIGQAAKHPEKPRVLLRLRLFRPSSPAERSSFLAASMSREAKQIPTVLPIEQTPTGNTIHKQHLLCAY